VLEIFNQVMEDGHVIDSTAADQTHPALTSIHIDMNKQTDLFPEFPLRGATTLAQRLEDILIPMNTLSRFDVIIEIPRDPQGQMQTALGMYEQSTRSTAPAHTGQETAGWARDLQVLVALLRTRHEIVSFPPEIQEAMRQKQEAFCKTNAKQLADIDWLSDFPTRLTQSVFKIVAAYARMHDRSVACDEDVDMAFHLLRWKSAFLTTLSHHLQTPPAWKVPQRDALRDWLQERFAGREVQTGEILQTYQDEFDCELEPRTLGRHLQRLEHQRLAHHIQHGCWRFLDEAIAADRGDTSDAGQNGTIDDGIALVNAAPPTTSSTTESLVASSVSPQTTTGHIIENKSYPAA
jgi:hypothetical protein